MYINYFILSIHPFQKRSVALRLSCLMQSTASERDASVWLIVFERNALKRIYSRKSYFWKTDDWPCYFVLHFHDWTRRSLETSKIYKPWATHARLKLHWNYILYICIHITDNYVCMFFWLFSIQNPLNMEQTQWIRKLWHLSWLDR